MGDVNGDGRADVVVSSGTRAARRRRTWCSASASTAAVDLRRLRRGGFAIRGGRREFGDVGDAVSGAGDFNGDGFADVAVGAPQSRAARREGAGATFVVFGARRPGKVDVRALGRRGFEIDGEQEFANFGEALAPLGDVNGDGRGDLLVGASQVSTPRSVVRGRGLRGVRAARRRADRPAPAGRVGVPDPRPGDAGRRPGARGHGGGGARRRQRRRPPRHDHRRPGRRTPLQRRRRRRVRRVHPGRAGADRPRRSRRGRLPDPRRGRTTPTRARRSPRPATGIATAAPMRSCCGPTSTTARWPADAAARPPARPRAAPIASGRWLAAAGRAHPAVAARAVQPPRHRSPRHRGRGRGRATTSTWSSRSPTRAGTPARRRPGPLVGAWHVAHFRLRGFTVFSRAFRAEPGCR